VLVHGLEGSGEAGYIRSMAHAGLEAGYTVHRFHMRTCGGTAHLCGTLYHAGLTSDLLAVVKNLQSQNGAPVHLVGYSLGGNVVLKLAGELKEQGPELIASVSALSTPIDLEACARRIGRFDNRFYERRFLKKMRERIGATGSFSAHELRQAKSIFEFDDRFTGPSFGFRDAEDYYTTQSAQHFLDNIRVPTLLIQAKDDTFIPFAVFDHPAFQRNPCLHLIATAHGGHLGFISRTAPRFWSDGAVMEWIVNHTASG
jgi:predicted alpha/beta-fold hydrolase